MNTALSWIKAYVPDLDVTAQEYTDAMTLTGTKVEGYTCLDKNLEKIVVGEILEVEGHPDADKLVVCQVNVGAEEPVQIVTGAPNITEESVARRSRWCWTEDAWPEATTAAPFLRKESRLKQAS
ncbi:MAG: hypothetical protein ACLTW9_09080 [Enterocloster sp.]